MVRERHPPLDEVGVPGVDAEDVGLGALRRGGCVGAAGSVGAEDGEGVVDLGGPVVGRTRGNAGCGLGGVSHVFCSAQPMKDPPLTEIVWPVT